MAVCTKEHDGIFHQDPIISICRFPQCTSRIACGRCQLDYHKCHADQLMKISDFQKKFLEEYAFNNQQQQFEELKRLKKDVIQKIEEQCNIIKQGFIENHDIQWFDHVFIDRVISGDFIQTRLYQKIQTLSNTFLQILKALDQGFEPLLIQLLVKDKKYDDCLYSGQIFNGQREGQGLARIYDPNDQSRINEKVNPLYMSTYQGQWERDKRNGVGKQTWVNNDIYEGQYKDNQKHGVGKFKFGDGRTYDLMQFRYEGEFNEDKMQGKGKMIYKDGSTYEGEFMDDQICGQGLYKTQEHIYRGEFKFNKKNGVGLINCSDGYIYRGSFQDNFRHGQGISVYPNGDIFQGQYINNERNGFGRMLYSDNDEYVGNYVNGNRNGQGSIFSQGDMKSGIWLNKEIISGYQYFSGHVDITTIKVWLRDQIPRILQLPEANNLKKKN